MADFRRRARQLCDRGDGKRRRGGALPCGAESALDAPGLHLRTCLEPVGHPARRRRRLFRMGRLRYAQREPGSITGSMEPLNWAQGEYINLLADIAANKVLDIPPAVCSRYHACVLPPGAGQVEVDFNVDAVTQWGQYMYVTGNTSALGAWNTNLALPVDSSYPVWKNSINLPAGGAIQYKYYRKNSDGSVTWE